MVSSALCRKPARSKIPLRSTVDPLRYFSIQNTSEPLNIGDVLEPFFTLFYAFLRLKSSSVDSGHDDAGGIVESKSPCGPDSRQ